MLTNVSTPRVITRLPRASIKRSACAGPRAATARTRLVRFPSSAVTTAPTGAAVSRFAATSGDKPASENSQSRAPEAVIGNGTAEPTRRTPLSSVRSNEPIEMLASMKVRAMGAGTSTTGGPTSGPGGAAATALLAAVCAGGFALPAHAAMATTTNSVHAPRAGAFRLGSLMAR